MREYGIVYGSFWYSPTIRAAGDDGRTVALYLLTSTQGNIVGCYRMPVALAADDLVWPVKRTAKAFDALHQSGFIERQADFVLIPEFLRWNKIAGPNQEIAAHKEARKLPGNLPARVSDLIECYRSYELKPEHIETILKVLRKGSGTVPQGFGNGSASVREPKSNQEQDHEYQQDHDQDHEHDLVNQEPLAKGKLLNLPTGYLGGGAK